MHLSKDDIIEISKILNTSFEEFGGGYSFSVSNTAGKQSFLLTVYTEAMLDTEIKGILVSIQTQHGYFEIHGCNAWLLFEPDEVIFLQYTDTKVSSLVVGANGNCSLFSNISRKNLAADFAKLDPAVLLSAMQLSLTEHIIN